MSRIRSIKPDLWKNEKLGEMDPMAVLLFVGLWNLADRRGFIEDRPKRIKAEIFPYREGVDIEGLISLLMSEFIRRVDVNGTSYIQVINFQKHQICNKKEAESVVPECFWNVQNCEDTDEENASTVQAQYQTSSDTQQASQEGKGREWNRKGTGKEQEGREMRENAGTVQVSLESNSGMTDSEKPNSEPKPKINGHDFQNQSHAETTPGERARYLSDYFAKKWRSHEFPKKLGLVNSNIDKFFLEEVRKPAGTFWTESYIDETLRRVSEIPWAFTNLSAMKVLNNHEKIHQGDYDPMTEAEMKALF